MAAVGCEAGRNLISRLQEGGTVVLWFLLHFLRVPILYERLVQKYKITHREHSVATDDDVEFATIRNVKWTQWLSLHAVNVSNEKGVCVLC